MRLPRSSFVVLISVAIFLLCLMPRIAPAQLQSQALPAHSPQRQAAMVQLHNGIEVRASGLRLKVAALRDDVLRIQLTRGSVFPEDASWAVLAEARQSKVPVEMEVAAATFGFHTNALTVEIDKKTLEVTVRDLAGNIVARDGLPTSITSGWGIRQVRSTGATKPSPSGTQTLTAFRSPLTQSTRASPTS
jgi:hypothetical protein